MTTQTLFEILESWLHNWDRTDIDITLNQISNAFNNKKVRFLLIDKIWGAIGYIDDIYDYINEGINMAQFEMLLRDEQFKQVAKFVRIESSGPPAFKITVLNIEEVVGRFPEWSEEFKGISWDEFGSSLLK